MALRVVVIGGGVAGLTCASTIRSYLLKNKTMEGNVEIVVVEASDYKGGRVRQTPKGFLPSSLGEVDLGAEFVHGDTNALARLVDMNGWPRHELFTWSQGDGGPSDTPAPDGGVGYYYIGRERRLLRYNEAEARPDLQHLHKTLWSLAEQQGEEGQNNPAEMTLRDFLRERGVSETMMAMADAGYANTAGGTLDTLDLGGTIHTERLWLADGEGDCRVKPSMRVVVDALSRGVEVRLSWPVTRVVSGDAEAGTWARVDCADGSSLEASHVVVAVPLPVIRDGDIEFVPSLPSDKLRAAREGGLGMGRHAIKVLAKFSRRPYPADCHGIVCSDSFIPELWMHDFGEEGEKGGVACVVTGFAMSGAAQRMLNACGGEEVATEELERRILSRAVEQLDEVFGTPGRPRPASEAFVGGMVVDWAKNPRIRGGYCFPRATEAPAGGGTPSFQRACATLARREGRIFFAGEATCTGKIPPMTLHTAMETGIRAAQEVISDMALSPTSRL